MDRVSHILLSQLTGGPLEPGTRLDGERELAGRLGVQRSTIRAAIDALADAGHLVRGLDDAIYVARYRGPTSRPGIVTR